MRPVITEALAFAVARRHHAGEPAAALAAEFRLAEWVVRLIVDAHPPDAEPANRPEALRPRAAGVEPALDPADVARCRRLKREGKSIDEIAGVLGLHQTLVRAALRKKPRFGPKESLRRGERYVTKPTVCPTCQMPLRIVPCRACRIREMIRRGEKTWPEE